MWRKNQYSKDFLEVDRGKISFAGERIDSVAGKWRAARTRSRPGCGLSSQGICHLVQGGSRLHADALERRVDRHLLSSSIGRMYVKCGPFAKARQVVGGLSVRDIVFWNTLIAAYGQQGQRHEEMLNCFEQMQNEGIFPDALTFAYILKVCSKTRDVERGKQIHHRILNRGLLKRDIVLGNALVNMYAKCGMLTRAQQVLEELPVRNVISWSTLIAGYALEGQGHEALNCFEQMQKEGFSADAITLTSVLKACSSFRDIAKGKRIHDEILSTGIFEKDILLGSALVDMYAKRGFLATAYELLEKLPFRNVISWSAVIAGYAEFGRGHEALNCFEQMKNEGLYPDVVTFISVLRACSLIKDVGWGNRIHDEIVSKGLLKKNIAIGNALVDMYARCHMIAKAEEALKELPIRDVISWSTLIAGYAEEGQGDTALGCLKQMQNEGFFPDPVTFISVLKACGGIGAIEEGMKIHNDISSIGFLEDNIMLVNGLVDMYCKCGILPKARQVLEKLLVREVVSWNILIAGCVNQGNCHEALDCFEWMQSQGLSPDIVTFIFILKACASIGSLEIGKQVHRVIMDWGTQGRDIMVNNVLVDMYVKCGMFPEAENVLKELPDRDVVSWNTLIAGYARQGRGYEVLNSYGLMQTEGLCPSPVTLICILKALGRTKAVENGKQIHSDIIYRGLMQNDIILGNSVVDMYSKFGMLAQAQQILEELPVRDVVSWNTLIAGYARQEHCQKAIYCFQRMRNEGLCPDAITLVCLLKVYGSTGAINKGKGIHEIIIHRGLLRNDIVLGNALVSMYARCGMLGRAQKVLEELPVRDVVTWNAVIAGYAQQGHAHRAMDFFQKLQSEGLMPNMITFLCLLSACSRRGLLDDAQMLFRNMTFKYRVIPTLEHCTCMVVVFGQAGCFDSAMSAIRMMPSSDYLPIWLALLVACRKWGNAKLGRLAFHQVITVDSDCSAGYVLIKNDFAAVGVRKNLQSKLCS